MNRMLAAVVVASGAALAACGGAAANDPQLTAGAAKNGGTATAPVASPLPSSAPSPDMVVRESFGFGPSFVRPAGGNGTLKSTFGNLDGFWAEWPGAAAMWRSAEGGWSWAGCSVDPLQLPSPLETTGNDCTVSSWAGGVARFPDAILPFAGLPGAYELSADVIPAVLAGSYVAIGLTASTATTANLQSAGQLWLAVAPGPQLDGVNAVWALRAGDATAGTVLASGTTILSGFAPLALRVDPAAQTVTASVNGAAVGTFAAPGVAPRFLAIEGQGVLDDLVVRSLP